MSKMKPEVIRMVHGRLVHVHANEKGVVNVRLENCLGVDAALMLRYIGLPVAIIVTPVEGGRDPKELPLTD